MKTRPTLSADEPHDTASGKVLTFGLGGETYGLDILRVQEIRGWSAITHIPQSPCHVLGVLTRRSSMVLFVGLKVRLGLDGAELIPVTVIIVLSVTTSSGRGHSHPGFSYVFFFEPAADANKRLIELEGPVAEPSAGTSIHPNPPFDIGIHRENIWRKQM